MRQKLSWFLVIVAAMALGGAVVVGIDSASGNDNGATSVIERVTSPSDSTTTAVSTTAGDLADLYDAVRPSVVRINGQGRTGAGSGSGIILDKQGNILTNNHVVSGFDQIDVTLSDGTASSATIVGTDPGNDLAIIKVNIPAEKLQPAKLGESSKVRVGEQVIAVGNPFGIEGTLTEGIVSGVGRTLASGSGRPLRQLIQSDAAINPGNSGGGLFNMRGELIGVTSAIENPSGDRVFVGIGYSVPIDTAQRFLPDLLAGQQIQHPRMGIGLTDLTPALAKTLGVSVEQGVVVTNVETNSAAARAGLKGGTGTTGAGGDVIVAIDGKTIKSYNDLANYIDSKKVGDKIDVKVVRAGGSESTFEVTLEAWRSNGA